MAGIVALTSSALTDRILVHTGFLRNLEETRARIWAVSANNPKFERMWRGVPAEVEPFPEIRPYPEFPHNYLRRLNEFTWDLYLKNPSRLSAKRHIRDKSQRWYVRMLHYPAKAIAALGLHRELEDSLEQLMLSYNRTPEALRKFEADPPDVLLTTGSFRYEEPAVAAAAKRLGIRTLCLITSWDNISIKGRMVFQYDGYIVWSQQMKKELRTYYPHSRGVPVYVVGAPQFDVFFDSRYHVSREEFCSKHGLVPDKPVILHALGVANGVEEQYGALDLARRVASGALGDVQLIVRPHPFHNGLEMVSLFREFGSRVVVQQNSHQEARNIRSQDENDITEWVNTFRHADVVVHLSSTAAIDAALFDRPSVCMDYDPKPGQKLQTLVREVNHLWIHYKPVAHSGGTWLVKNPDEMESAIRAYLDNPALHRAERRKMAEYVCGYIDGRCGERMADAVLDFTGVAKGLVAATA